MPIWINYEECSSPYHYNHPEFYESTTQEKLVLNEYHSFFDLFQYSSNEGKYYYLNGNGRYHAEITKPQSKSNQITKKNLGYLDVKDRKRPTIIKSLYHYSFDQADSNCFYKHGDGIEIISTPLVGNASVKTDASVTIIADKQRALPASHFFYTLTSDISLWPSFKKDELFSKKEAYTKLKLLIPKLTQLTSTSDRKDFLNALLKDYKTWSYLNDYIEEKGVADDVSRKLFWALGRIDNTPSVNALASLATSQLEERDLYRASLALGSTSAPFDEASIELLKTHMVDASSSDDFPSSHFTFIRMLGAMADNRGDSAHLQSNAIKDFLYTQAGMYSETVNAAVLDAIGNLGQAIDQQGKDILFQSLSTVSNKVRSSAISAFKRVPYDAEHSDIFINQLTKENNLQLKNEIIQVLGGTDNSDMKVKKELLTLIQDPKLSSSSLGSLKKINYELETDDIQLLESKLRNEGSNINQKILASLILKHRRQQAKKRGLVESTNQ